MWIAISLLLAVACVALSVRANRHRRGAEDRIGQLRAEIYALQEKQKDVIAEKRAHQLAIFNSMVEGILIVDEQGRIQTANKSLERLFNLSTSPYGKTVMEAFRLHELLEITERAHKEEVVREHILTIPGIQQTRFLEVNAAAIRSFQNQLDGVILIFHDITRIKELENIRKDFVANVSHELRTPLTLIKGFVETLLDGAKDDPSVSTRFLQTIHKHTNRLTFLIEDLLTLSRLESGEALVHPTFIRFHDLVSRVLDELQVAAAQRSIALKNSVPPDLILNIDAERMEQVIYNLVDNGIKYGKSGGTIQVETQRDPEGSKISVKDDGPGIPPEAIDRIFERFYRADKARSRQAGGTGLGLAIVKHIVQLHGGKVWAESKIGEGSTFHFTLPQAGEGEESGKD